MRAASRHRVVTQDVFTSGSIVDLLRRGLIIQITGRNPLQGSSHSFCPTRGFIKKNQQFRNFVFAVERNLEEEGFSFVA